MILRAALLTVLASAALAQNGDRAGEEQPPLPDDLEIPPAPALQPDEAAATLAVHEGFEVTLAAAEPLVVDPVQIVFDGSGRLWVVEMRGYMPDATGEGEDEPIGRIAVLTDEDGDGAFDSRQDFADGLVMPRSVHPCEGGALAVLPPRVVFLPDEDGDGRADDAVEVLEEPVAGLANPEHAINGLLYGRDNWYHLANWSGRYRRVDGEWTSRRDAGGGQWGSSQDDVGRLYFNTNPDPVRGDVVASAYAVRNPHLRGFWGANVRIGRDSETFPSRINPGVNRGYRANTLRDDFTLRVFTAACSPVVYRGGAFGTEAEGDVFVCEPSGNLVKRYDVRRAPDGIGLEAHGVVERFDFLTSTDERFRPVAGAVGPDGALYVADMYRGIIQHRIYMTSFLRAQVEERGLEGPIHLGRIWRVARTDAEPHAVPDLSSASWSELIAALGHPSGTVRDAAQRLVVEDFAGDPTVAQELREFAGAAEAASARIAALWTLAGIDELTPRTIGRALGDEDPRVVHAGVRVAEPWLKLQGTDLVTRVLALGLTTEDPWIRHQVALSLGEASAEAGLRALAMLAKEDVSTKPLRTAILSGLRFREHALLDALAEDAAWRDEAPGRPEFLRLVASCISREGLGEHRERVVALAVAPPGGAEWWRGPLLEGLLEARRKGPKGETLPLKLARRPPALDGADTGALATIEENCTWPGKPGAPPEPVVRPLTEEEQGWYDRGEAVYRLVCATCHQPHGGGEPGKAPPLRGTTWVLGDESRLVKILLHGLGGKIEVDGEVWDAEMPRFEGSDVDLAAVATYVRRTWGNGADPVAPGVVEEVKEATEGRTQPYSVEELE